MKIATVVVSTILDPAPGQRGPGPHTAGGIKPLVRGQRFVAVLTGSDNVRQVFERHGDVFTAREGGATGC